MIVSELKFFEIEREFHGIYAMIFHQSLFSERPGSFDTVDIDFTISEPFTVVNASVFDPYETRPL